MATPAANPTGQLGPASAGMFDSLIWLSDSKEEGGWRAIGLEELSKVATGTGAK